MYKVIIFLFIFFITTRMAWAWPAHVERIIDGDTFVVHKISTNEFLKIRLYGIDTPERKQRYGTEAKDFVSEITSQSRIINIEDRYKDIYDRTIALVYLQNGLVLQELLLCEGLAWVDRRYCKDCSYWQQLEREAKIQTKGLWSIKNTISPWEWRNRKYRNR